MTRVNLQAVFGHCIRNFMNDGSSSSFDPQDLCDLDDVVRRRMGSNDAYKKLMKNCCRESGTKATLGYHNLLKAVAFHDKFFLTLLASQVFLVFLDDNGTANGRDTLEIGEISFNIKGLIAP